MLKALRVLPLCALAALGYTNVSIAAGGAAPHDCDEDGPLCKEVADSIGYAGAYTGHDEPALIFYSNTAGSGNRMTWTVRLPAEPPTPPDQAGTGGTYNFQLHVAFWFGMVVCDDQAAPNPGGSTVGTVTLTNVACRADSDVNIYASNDVTNSHYIGRHPGAAYMEMQFYPPSSPIGCGNPDHPNQWCAALNIDSYSINLNTRVGNNADCQNNYGIEPVNFAFITQSGTPVGPSALIGTPGFFGFVPPDADTLFMNKGDLVRVEFEDTAHGLKVTIRDLTTGDSGSMVASAENGFAQVVYQPNATTCSIQSADFRPMYASTSENTTLPWGASTFNVGFVDEIGHYEYCNQVDGSGGTDAVGDVYGNCTVDGINDLNTNNNLVGDDDYGCVDSTNNTAGFVANIGCTGTDTDFSGVPYQLSWPGTDPRVRTDRALHPTPISFSSPVFTDRHGRQRNYSRVAFNTDLPRIEAADLGGNCDRLTGAGCTNPPPNANFYPIFTTQGEEEECRWNLGGPYLPGTSHTFGGSSTTEYGPLLAAWYPYPTGPQVRINVYQQTLSSNPCPNRSNDE
jgi:hypothetical protein